jgi:hypothetical protein
MTPALANQAENLSRIVEASLFKMEHFQTQKRPTEKESPDGPPSGLENNDRYDHLPEAGASMKRPGVSSDTWLGGAAYMTTPTTIVGQARIAALSIRRAYRATNASPT